ncbi:MAG: glyceraldehyde-3-phosphate dehydrogenase [Flavobacteriales bacterium]|nr:glyceraldehyde-3-phosphate dehydrogenase [Flavobacteriales bacterium]
MRNYQEELKERISEERAAIELIKITSDLSFEKSIELIIFRNQLIDQRSSEILNLHEYAKKFVQKPINIRETLAIAKTISESDLPPSKIDIGKMTFEWINENKNYVDIKSFVADKLHFVKKESTNFTPKDVVLYGFGRIGRLLARELMTQEGKGEQLRLRVIVLRNNDDQNIIKRASLLRTDSVHGKFPGTVVADLENKALIINGQSVKLIKVSNPDEVDYTTYGIDNALLIDNTGAYRDKEALGRHLQSKGVSKVLLTAPGNGVPNIVFGANHLEYDLGSYNIFSAASCTTNAITPILQVVNNNLGIKKGHIETIHAYTNDQNLVDNMHKKERRGRSAALNMVITNTGAGKAVVKVIPDLEGKLTANAVRVPTPNGSLAILNLTLDKTTSVEVMNNIMKNAALEGSLVEQINYSISNELVSTDIVGNNAPSVYDSPATIVSKDGNNIVLYVWYDNEYGYSRQVMRLAKYIAEVRRPTNY